MARGVGPSATQALAIEDVDVATSQSRAANLLNLMPYFIIFALFSGGGQPLLRGAALCAASVER